MGRLSPELEEFFKEKGIELEAESCLVSGMPPASRSRVQPKRKPKIKGQDRRGRTLNLLIYILGCKELRGYEKISVLAVVGAYVRGNVYQARIRIMANQASCSRATIFRALQKLVPKWLEKISRPGKPNILRPSRMLIKYLRLDQEGSGLDRDYGRPSRGSSLWRLNIGTFR